MMTNRVTKSSGNVFADIGVRNPAEALVKAKLARVIARTIEAKHMTQLEAADLPGIDQPRGSNLVRGRLAGFSIDRLFRFLTVLGSDIEIVVIVSTRRNKPGPMKVAVA
jgi:predicted XRE-type DNA-binding protein